jgi:alkanesulfonate monooxygenase SsuD/methylene tetrahydromethanopterin reductase-like flavin-dependent oxidoreductase (luciferase family)
MHLGIGLPSTVPTATGSDVLTWAREADAAGFSSLGTIDRVVYGNHETIATIAAAAAVTSRIRLTTAILITPFRGNGALLAKQLASVDSFSGGRLTVGVAVGGRPDDYAATAVDFETRGKTFDAQLAEFGEVWGGASRGTSGAIGPRPVQPGGPPLLIGGTSAAAIRRTVTHGAGWIAGGGGPQMFAQGAEEVRRAWNDADRPTAPRLAALGYFALGPDAPDLASAYLRDYYAFIPDYVDFIVGGALTSDDAVRAALVEFAEAGCDELILFPCAPDPDQLRRLADVGLPGAAEQVT